jgi:hypothetical protein
VLVGGEKIFCLEIKAHPDSSNRARGGRRKRCVRALLKTVVFIGVFLLTCKRAPIVNQTESQQPSFALSTVVFVTTKTATVTRNSATRIEIQTEEESGARKENGPERS